jgi:phospholipase/carboxylesterase
MNDEKVVINKDFRIGTQNLLFLPKGYRKGRKWPLVVALHGMGMSAEEFANLLAPLRSLPAILFVPEGVYPFEIRVAGQTGLGRGWYLYTGDRGAFVDSMQKTGRHLRALTDRLSREYPIDRGRRVLLGFSQGGYLAAYEALRDAARWRGLAIIAARVEDELLGDALKKATGLSVLLQHGLKDRAVPFSKAEKSRDALLRAGIEVKFRPYDSGHHLTAEQTRDARDWLSDLIGR